MKAKIFILPRKAVRDPQSESVLQALREHFQLTDTKALSLGRFYEIQFAPNCTPETVQAQVTDFARKTANPIMEDYRVEFEA